MILYFCNISGMEDKHYRIKYYVISYIRMVNTKYIHIFFEIGGW